MNEIEQMFYDAFLQIVVVEKHIHAQVPIGIYVADFVLFPTAFIPSIVEIDGHEWHKTKEQRFADYKKERYFISQGYSVIRFMGSEIYVDAERCACDALELSGVFDEKMFTVFNDGLREGREQLKVELGLEE